MSKFEKRDLTLKGTDKKVFNREFGEILESRLTPEEAAKNLAEPDVTKHKKPNLYIKITADIEDLQKLQPGFTLTMEDPKAKYQRQLLKFAHDEQASENIIERMNNIPKFVKKRLTMRIPA